MEHGLLSEEKYQKTKSKVAIVAVVVLVIGLLIGGGLIATGVIKSMNAEKEASLNVRTAEEVEAEIDDVSDKLAKLKSDQNIEFDTNGFSEEFYRIGNEIDKLQTKKSELTSELFKINSGYYNNNFKNKVVVAPFYMFGAFIIISSLMISGSIFMFTKRREMLAFSMQQVMPVATEGLEKVAPTVSKVGSKMMKDMAPAYGEVAEEIAKGIKNGTTDNEEDE